MLFPMPFQWTKTPKTRRTLKRDRCASSEIRRGELEDKSDGGTKRTTDVKSEMHASEERNCVARIGTMLDLIALLQATKLKKSETACQVKLRHSMDMITSALVLKQEQKTCLKQLSRGSES
ncbi:uncharacterized protein LOC122951907 [Acropora millepora]|uniref:uncharacterized protein LOC122951907 n=1 Tax=Acropora millepora TaxID=45264 RepID=UPI001CF108D7|nr:uncharacterized protein LOC122951907 [Acropora millepora]